MGRRYHALNPTFLSSIANLLVGTLHVAERFLRWLDRRRNMCQLFDELTSSGTACTA